MSGGIVQLVATGAQDAWLTGKPEVSFFRSNYRRYTHYASSTERQVIQGAPIAGGISTGQPIVVRMALKPTSSILTPRRTVTIGGEETEISTKGRHDPCVGIRATPIAEALLALVVMDHALLHRAQCGDVQVAMPAIPGHIGA